MDMSAEISVETAAGDEQRYDQRFQTNLTGGVRRSGSNRIPATIRDLSRTGFRVDTTERLPLDSVVWLKVGQIEPLMARVVWSDGLMAGCRFAAPIHPSIVGSLVGAG